MTDLETLKKFAKCRKLPKIIYLGNTSQEWKDYAINIAENTSDSLDYSIKNRTSSPLPGSKTDDYSVLTSIYSQRNVFDDIDIPECLSDFEDIHNIRFAILKPKSSVPEHLDSPETYRLISVIKGQHDVWSEGEKFPMNEGEVYFINGCFKHKVDNLTDIERVAFLAKMPITGKNTNELLRIRT